MSTVSTVQPDLRRKRVNWQKVLVIVLFAVVPLFLLMLFIEDLAFPRTLPVDFLFALALSASGSSLGEISLMISS